MKFYDRIEELRVLREGQQQSFTDHSRFTVMTCRRRIGKTKLVLKSCEGEPTVYLFVARKNEGDLCQKFAQVIRDSLQTFVPDHAGSFISLFTSLMELGKYRCFNLVIDEFQELFYINESIFSEMQDVWDRYKEGTQTVRYEIADNFLRFWFRYINRNRDFIEAGNLKGLAQLIKADYPTYSGETLERYFRQQLSEQFQYRNIGSWWDTGKGRNVPQNEVDIVAIQADNRHVLIGEVKRQRKNFKPELLQQKADLLRTKLFAKYEIETRCFTLEDM